MVPKKCSHLKPISISQTEYADENEMGDDTDEEEKAAPSDVLLPAALKDAEYRMLVKGWGISQKSVAGKATMSAAKLIDQSTPMMITKFHGRSGLALVMLLWLVSAASFMGGFFSVVTQLANCNENNGCKVCSASVEVIKNDLTTCEAMSETVIQIDASCASFSFVNEYATFERVITYGKDVILPKLYEELTSMEEDMAIYASYSAQLEIFDCFKQNFADPPQLADPDSSCIQEKWATKYWSGVSDSFNVRMLSGDSYSYDTSNTNYYDGDSNPNYYHDDGDGGDHYRDDDDGGDDYRDDDDDDGGDDYRDDDDDDDDNTPTDFTPYAIQNLYSVFSLTCLMFSAGVSFEGGGWESLGFTSANGIEYMTITTCGCRISCPMTEIIGSASHEATDREGLGDLRVRIPTHYISMSHADYTKNGEDEQFTMEAVKSDGTHCASATVSGGTPASLKNALYKCCTKKSMVSILSEANAFGAFLFTVATLAMAAFYLPAEYYFFTLNEDGLRESAGDVIERFVESVQN